VQSYMDWILVFVAVASLVVNTWWSKKYAEAKNVEIIGLKTFIEALKASHTDIIKGKDTVIEAKNAEISAIKEKTPQTIRDAYKATTEIFDDYFQRNQQELTKKQKEIQELEQFKSNLQKEVNNLKEEVSHLEEEKEEILSENEYLRPLAEESEARRSYYEEEEYQRSKDERGS
jgi:hypothetical protein